MSTCESTNEKKKAYEMCFEHLIKASKQGNMTSALLWLGQINILQHHDAQHNQLMCDSNPIGIHPLDTKTVKYLFYYSDEHHSALHHAASNGHAELVEYYLCLYLIFAMRISFDTIHKSQSFRTWFLDLNTPKKKMKKKKLQFPQNQRCIVIGSKRKDKEKSSKSKVFSLSDYDKLAVQSNDQNVLNIMIKKKVDIVYAMTVIDRASSSCVPYVALIQPRMKKVYLDVKSVIEKKRRKRLLKPALVNDMEKSALGSYYEDDDFLNDDNDIFSSGSYDDTSDYNDTDSCFLDEQDQDFIFVRNRNATGPTITHEIKFIDVEADLLCIELE